MKTPALIILFFLSLAPPLSQAQARNFDALQAIDDWNRKLSAADKNEKYCKMQASPFAFYRASNHLFWADFFADPRLGTFSNNKTRIWLLGDLHAANYGAYDNDQGDIVYGLNDFDESLIADYQYDVWRMAVSIVLIARAHSALSLNEQAQLLDAFSETYLDHLAAYHGNNQELSARYTATTTYGLLDNFLRDVAQNNSRTQLLNSWTLKINGQRRFDLSNAKLDAVSDPQYAAISQALNNYGPTLNGALGYNAAYFRIKDIAQRRHAGLGSLGTPRFYVLIEGASAGDDDDRLLDLKRQGKPSAYTFLDTGARNAYDQQFHNEGQRHALAMNALTAHTDNHLGYLRLADGDYSVRERSAYKASFALQNLTSLTRLTKLSQQWGAILASAHASADQDYDKHYIDYSFDAQVDRITDTHHQEFRALVRQIALDYADQVAIDWQTFVGAYGTACSD